MKMTSWFNSIKNWKYADRWNLAVFEKKLNEKFNKQIRELTYVDVSRFTLHILHVCVRFLRGPYFVSPRQRPWPLIACLNSAWPKTVPTRKEGMLVEIAIAIEQKMTNHNKDEQVIFLFIILFYVLGGVMVRTLDLWLAVAGSNPSHDTAWLFLR